MDFTPELSAFHGVITSADNVHLFSRLSARGGNEQEIKHVIEIIRKFLEENKYISKDGLIEESISTVRKFALYIILNADLPILEEMVDMDGIDMVIWTIPTIPKCLMCEMFWNLHMEKFMYEAISFSSPLLALQLATAFIDSFKYFSPVECLLKLKLLSAACYSLIYRLYIIHYSDIRNSKISIEITTAFNYFKKCINYYSNPPNAHKLNLLNKDDLYRHQGKCYQSMLLLIDECFNHSANAEKGIFNEPDDIYLLTYNEINFSTKIHIHDDSKHLLLECMNDCNCCLLDICKDLVVDISVDIFCAWSEFEENGKSMQHTIGELCYKVRTKLLKFSSISEHPVISMLQQFARKPVELKDIVNTMDSDCIIENINKNNNDKVAWLQASLHKDQLSNCFDLINVITNNLEYFSKEECFKIYKILQEYLNTHSENIELIEPISAKVFQQCDISIKHKILKERFIQNIFFDMKESTEFQNMMTEIFNKLIVSPESDITDVLAVFLQSPKQVYAKIFKLAADNTHQTDIMLKLMKLLDKFSNHYYNTETEPCLIKITQDTIEHHLDTEKKQDNFIKFICCLKTINIISGSKLLMLIIMTNMHKALLNKDIDRINVTTKLLREAYRLEELLEYRAPMLAMLAQVFEMVRWKIDTFVPLAPAALTAALQLQTSILDTYHADVPENEGRWLKSKLNNLQPLNMYYYRILWNPPGSNFFEVISGQNISEVDTHYLTTWLSQVVCSCTQQEWCDIWDSISVCTGTNTLMIFHNALSMITVAEKLNRTETTWSCLLYCYRNFVYIIRYKFFKEPLTDSQVMSVTECIATSANLIKENIEEIGTVFLPLFAYLTERNNDYTFELSKSLSDIMNKVISNSSAQVTSHS